MPFCKVHKNIAMKGGVCPECAKIGPPTGMPTGVDTTICAFPSDGGKSDETPDTNSPDPTDSGAGGDDSSGD